MPSSIHFFIHRFTIFVCSFADSLLCSFIHAFILWFTHLFIHSLLSSIHFIHQSIHNTQFHSIILSSTSSFRYFSYISIVLFLQLFSNSFALLRAYHFSCAFLIFSHTFYHSSFHPAVISYHIQFHCTLRQPLYLCFPIIVTVWLFYWSLTL